MSSSFNQRYERKFNGNYSWSNPIWRRHRLKMLRRRHQMRERLEENPNYWVDLFKENIRIGILGLKQIYASIIQWGDINEMCNL